MDNNDENKLYESIENNEWQPVNDFANIKSSLIKAASETAMKDYRMNIRISKRDVEALKTKAMEEGIPYQTLVTSILHKYITGNLIDAAQSAKY